METLGLLPAIALAQHSGIPTRLLDWTRSSLVALYFAARDNVRLEDKPTHLSVWAVDPRDVQKQIIEAEIPYEIAGETVWLVYDCSMPFINISGHGNPNLRAQSGDLMKPTLRFNKLLYEAGGSSDPFERTYDLFPSDVVELTTLSIDSRKRAWPLVSPLYKKISLPSDEAPKLLEYLDKYGYHGGAIYPGLAGIADTAKERSHYQRANRGKETYDLFTRTSESFISLAGYHKPKV